MQKFCINCRNAFWGGQHCPNCFGGGNVELLDLALPENQKYLPEMQIDVRPKYFARTAMMLVIFGSIMSLPVGVFIFFRGMSESGNVGLWAAIGLGTIIGITWGSIKLANWIFGKQMAEVPKEKGAQYD